MSDNLKETVLYMECKDGTSNKFWEITYQRVRPNSALYHYSTRWGKIGTSGTTKKIDGEHFIDKICHLINTKRDKGYREKVKIAKSQDSKPEVFIPGGLEIF